MKNSNAGGRKLPLRMKLESDVILPKDIMRRIAELPEITLASIKEVMHSTPWRFKEYAPRILEILAEGSEKGNK